MNTQVDLLLVEDNPADAEFVIEALRSAHLAERVFHAHDGAEALDFLFAQGAFAGRVAEQPRLVLLDIKLPKVDGFEVLRRIREDPTSRLTPVVMLTSSNVERDIVRCYRLGVNSYVQKPMDFDAFRTIVQGIGRYWLGANLPPPVSAAQRAP